MSATPQDVSREQPPAPGLQALGDACRAAGPVRTGESDATPNSAAAPGPIHFAATASPDRDLGPSDRADDSSDDLQSAEALLIRGRWAEAGRAFHRVWRADQRRALVGLWVCAWRADRPRLAARAASLLKGRCSDIERRAWLADFTLMAEVGELDRAGASAWGDHAAEHPRGHSLTAGEQTGSNVDRLSREANEEADAELAAKIVDTGLEPLTRRALATLYQHRRRHPERADTHYHLAQLERFAGRTHEARENVDRALAINPNYARAAALRSKLTAQAASSRRSVTNADGP